MFFKNKISRNNPENSELIRYNSENFTIDEGTWGNYYGARFELWFEPKKGDEYKLLEENYKIEGWMR